MTDEQIEKSKYLADRVLFLNNQAEYLRKEGEVDALYKVFRVLKDAMEEYIAHLVYLGQMLHARKAKTLCAKLELNLRVYDEEKQPQAK